MAYGHRIQRIDDDFYRLSWTVDHKYANSRLRYPRAMSRDSDAAGAKRFAKKWDLELPPELATAAASQVTQEEEIQNAR